MKIMKKSLSVLLSLLMALSVFSGLTISVSAADPIDWTTSNSLPADPGSYVLQTDVNIGSNTWTPADGTILDLNGHKLTSSGTAISVENGVTFTIVDSKKDSTDPADKHYYTGNNPASLSNTETDDYFIGGYITGTTGSSSKGKITVQSGGNCIMNGGTVFGNRFTSDGGGVFVCGNNEDEGLPGGVFTLNGGNIIGNRASWGGGAYLQGGSTFNLISGSVSSNYAPNGGGGILTWGTFNMSGGLVSKNGSIGPAGFYLFTGEFHLSGGTITGNTSSRDQGGLGGAAKAYISGNPVVSGNKSRGSASDFYIPNEKTLTLEGELTEGASIGIQLQTAPSEGNPTTFVDGWGDFMDGAAPSDYFFSNQGSTFALNENGEIVSASNLNYDIPTDLTATYGQTLSDVTLPSGWSWNDATTSVGNVGTNSFPASSVVDDLTVIENLSVYVAKADSTASTVEAVEGWTYDTASHALITVTGEAVGGEMQYKLNDGEYGTAIPEATNAGEYTVYYKLVGDANHNDVAEQSVTVNVEKATPAYTVPTGLVSSCGKALSDVELPDGWTWDDPMAVVGGIGNDPAVTSKDFEHSATFTPADTVNYNTATEALTITVNNHSIVETVYPPTCTNDGYTVYMCVCGYYRIDDHITALEHDYDEGVHVDPTCEVPGGTLYTCTRPGCSEDEELHTLFIPNESEEPALGHDMGSWYIAPHPTIDGAYVYKRDCSRDGCRHYEYECDANENINVYHKVMFFTDFALPADGYIIAEDGTKLADTTKYTTVKVGEDFYVIDGGKIDFEDTPRFEAFRYATREYSEYRVTDWSVSLENITSNLEAHAVYTGLEIYHTVRFVLPDTTQYIEYHNTGATVLHGHAATAPSVDPTKASNATYNYVFTGWDKDFSKVYSNITVTAQFNEVKRNYKLVYHDKDGAVIGSEIFNNGDPAIAYPATLEPYEDDNYNYVFNGAWKLENGASFSLRTLTVPSYCYNEYNEALEGDESVANILKGIIDIYPVYEKTAKTVPVIINVSSTNGDVLNGAVVKVLNGDGLVAASRTIDGTTSVAFNLLAGEYTVSVSYDGETKVEPLTVTADGGSVSFAFEIREYEETPKECGCLCHIPIIGRIYVFFQSLIFKLTGKKTVCCDDMNSSPYASKRGYTV